MVTRNSRARTVIALTVAVGLAALAGAQEGDGAVEAVPVPEQVQESAGPTTLPPEEVEQLVGEASRAEATHIAGQDAATAERLRSIFAALDDLRPLRVEVEAGIVVLSGTVPTADDASRALEMAKALDGVVLVVDEIEVERSMPRRLASSWARVLAQLRSTVAFLPLLLAGLAIVGLTWLVARLLRDATFLYRLVSKRVLLQNLLRQTVYAGVLLGGVVAALRFLDAGALIGTALGAAGVVGLALGFAFRNIVENYLAGILLAIRQPFSVRDLVSIDGAVGTVLRMTTSETTLLDADGNHLRMPNAMVFNGKVLNYTRNPLRRFTVAVGVGNDVDLSRALELGIETLQRMKGVVDDPAPSAVVVGFGDSTVQLELYGWVDQREANFVRAASEAHRLVKAAFDQEGLAMPSPEYLVRLTDPLPGSERTESREPAPEPPPVDSGASPEEVDLSTPDDVTQQVEKDLEHSSEENLLAVADEPDDGAK